MVEISRKKYTVKNTSLDKIKDIYASLHPDAQSDFRSIMGNIFSKYPESSYKIKYIEVKQSYFRAYFKKLENKNGKIKAIKIDKKVKPKTKKRIIFSV